MSENLDDDRYKNTFGIDERPYNSLRLEVAGKKGPTNLVLRCEGASILQFSVDGKTILTSPDLGDGFEQPVKIDATHTMLPAGMAEVGPQHGASRYLKYETDYSVNSEAQLSARDGLRELGHTKTFKVLPDGLRVIDDVIKLGEDSAGLSLGEHYYFKIEEQQIPEIEILDSSGQATEITVRKKDGSTQTGTIKDLWPELSEGNSFFYEGYNGSQLLRLPTGEILKIEAYAESPEGTVPVQMLIWHRPNTDTVCFEPLAGRTLDSNGKLENNAVVLQPHQSMQLTSQVTLFELDNTGQAEAQNNATVREVKPGDIEGLRPVLEQAIRNPITKEIIQDEVEEVLGSVRESAEGLKDRIYVVAETTEGGVVGMMGLQTPGEIMKSFAATDNPAEIIHAYVAYDQRGMGTGRGLVKHLEELAKQKGYKEVILNSGPRYMRSGWPFWRRIYGEPAGVAKNFYDGQYDAMVWRKSLVEK